MDAAIPRRREKVLVFGDDMRIFLTVARSLGRAGIEVHAAPFNWHSPALRSKYIKAVHRLPRYADDALSWRQTALELLERHAFDAIIPSCDDRSILAFDAERETFTNFPMMLPDRSCIDVLFDKEKTRELCARLRIPVARGARLKTEDNAAGLVSRFGLPLIIKPRRSYWLDRLDQWGKVYVLDTEAEVAEVLNSLDDRGRYLVESYVTGSGVGVSVLAHEGHILQGFQHRRLREGKGGSSSYRVSEHFDAMLLAAAVAILQAVPLTGPCMFEFRRNDLTGEWVLLEVNARFWGSLALPVRLGVDFPLLAYNLLVHSRVSPPKPYRDGMRSRNLVLDTRNLLSEASRGGIAKVHHAFASALQLASHPVQCALGSECSDTMVADDPRPAFVEIMRTIRRVKGLSGAKTPPLRRTSDYFGPRAELRFKIVQP